MGTDAVQQVQHFFDATLPGLIRRNAGGPTGEHGSISVVVKEAGSWTLRLGATPERALKSGADYNADLTLVFSATGFLKVLQGPFESANDGEQSWMSDIWFLHRLYEALMPPSTGPLGGRLTIV